MATSPTPSVTYSSGGTPIVPPGYSDVNGVISPIGFRTTGATPPASALAAISPQPSLPTPVASQSIVNAPVVGAAPPSPAPLSSSLVPAPPGVTTVGPVTTPVTTTTQPSSSASPATTSPSDNALLQNVLNALSSGGNAAAAGSGAGVGADDTSLPSPTTADVEALQPTAVSTSSSGPNIGLIIGIVLVAALGVYLWYRHKKGAS